MDHRTSATRHTPFDQPPNSLATMSRHRRALARPPARLSSARRLMSRRSGRRRRRAPACPNGADNFYKSDKVTVQKVTFKNQYQMNVAGNLFVPKALEPDAKHARDRRRPPDGRGEGAERQPLRHQDGRAGLRHAVARPVVLGRERGPAAQRRLARPLRRELQRRGRLPGHAAVRRHASGSAPSAFAAAAASSSARPRSTRA